ILHEEGIEDYERFSWHMTDAAQRERETLGKFILYQTAEGKQGFFRQNGEMLYQVETRGGLEDDNQDEGSSFDIQKVKTQIKKLSVTEEKGKKQNEWKEPESGLYEIMLWKLWDGHMPAWGVGWDSAVIWDAIYRYLSKEDGMPAWEEIEEKEYLFVSLEENDRIGTLSDLEKLPHLKELHLNGNHQNPINFDLTKEMIPELEELSIGRIKLENLSFLEDFPQLKILFVSNCGLEDISGIECQRELREITFLTNALSDISPLKNCKTVESLTLAYSGIKDISLLAFLPELSELDICGNEISDITPLQYLPKLRKVDFSSNQVADLSPLRNMTELTRLAASYNQISDISPLAGMTKLDSLNLEHNEIQDIRTIGKLPMLQYLRLYHNQIQDFSPALELTQLSTLSIGENPGQNHIGDLVFLPGLIIGNGFWENEEMQQEAQEMLDRFYPDEELTAEDIVKGDLNGDGIVDLAITGLDETVNPEYDNGRKIYTFLRQADGSIWKLSPVDTSGPNSGGTHGDPYRGILITDESLVVKAYGGSNSYWESTDIYQYKNGEMEETWEIAISGYALSPGYSLYITNAEDGSYRWYAYAMTEEWEGEGRPLLLAQVGETLSPVEKDFTDKYTEYQERTGITLPEFGRGTGRPSISTGWYDYQIHNQLYDTERLPGEVLLEAAEKYLSEYQELPVPYYTSEEIMENYITLTGVELPEFLLIGQDATGSGTKMLAYSNCQQQEDGSYEHELSQWEISRGEWSLEHRVYYNEREGMFTVEE
ncbi:MAG: leucine-rich repeat domain-containing protein, partial [Lachnospiraceae bacterium]|nr:leucine-rich repeat domain-containing protein [Lachnospiraceae bacterium]